MPPGGCAGGSGGCGVRGEASGDIGVLRGGAGFSADRQRRGGCGAGSQDPGAGSREEPGAGRSAAIKESERLGGEERGECQTEKPGEAFNAVRAAIKEYDRYKSL